MNASRKLGKRILTALMAALAVSSHAASVSHYRLDGDGMDAQGVQDGTSNGSPATMAGKIGTALDFEVRFGDTLLTSEFIEACR